MMPVESAVVKIPVWRVAKQAYATTFKRPLVFVHLSWIPALVTALGIGAFSYWSFAVFSGLAHGANAEMPSLGRSLDFQTLIFGILIIGTLNVFVVRWHRLQLYGEVSGGLSNLFNPTWLRFFAYGLIIALPELLEHTWRITQSVLLGAGYVRHGFITEGFAVLWSIMTFGWGIYAFGCSLIFPAAAFGQPLTWRQAWRALRGNFWRLYLCSLITAAMAGATCLPAIVPIGIVLPARLYSIISGLIVVGTIVIFVVVAVLASTLCRFYQGIILRQEIV